MAARKIINVNWMKVHQPTLTEWTQRLNQIYIFEKMTADLQLKSDIFSTDLGINRNISTWSLKCCQEGLFYWCCFCFVFFIACDNLYLYLFICFFFSVNISSKCYVYIVMFLTSLIKTQFKFFFFIYTPTIFIKCTIKNKFVFAINILTQIFVNICIIKYY